MVLLRKLYKSAADPGNYFLKAHGSVEFSVLVNRNWRKRGANPSRVCDSLAEARGSSLSEPKLGTHRSMSWNRAGDKAW